MAFVTFIVNVVLRSVGCVEFIVQVCSFDQTFVTVWFVFTFSLIFFIIFCRKEASFVKELIMILWASIWACSITFFWLYAWISHHNTFQIPFVIKNWKRVGISCQNLFSQMSDINCSKSMSSDVKLIFFHFLESSIKSCQSLNGFFNKDLICNFLGLIKSCTKPNTSWQFQI